MVNHRQELMIQEIIKGLSVKDAYIRIYGRGDRSEHQLSDSAYQISTREDFQARLSECKALVVKNTETLIAKQAEAKPYTTQESMQKLIEIQNIALSKDNPDLASALKAEQLKGQLHKLYSENISITSNTQNNLIADETIMDRIALMISARDKGTTPQNEND